MKLVQRSTRRAVLLLALCLASLSAALAVARQSGSSAAQTPDSVLAVAATVETEPVPHPGDSADDPAIWVHPTNPAQSTIIGTDKHGGLAVYDLTGKQIQYLPDGNMNNVDVRSGFRLGGRQFALVTAGNRSDNSIAIYRVNPTTRLLEEVAARKTTTLTVYGSCMYHSRSTGKFYYFVNSKKGEVEQWELFEQGGKVDARKVRSFTVGSITEGCVADDESGQFYIGEENVAIWKYGAEPNASVTRTQVDKTGAGGHLVSNIEGLTIAYGRNGTGYLIASSQGNSTYVIYRREGNNQYVKTFRIVDGGGVDGTAETDGIDVTTANLGPAFPQGVFVAQDGHNDQGNQNYKLVPWQLIIGAETKAPVGTNQASSRQP